jgi:hypothetical protein
VRADMNNSFLSLLGRTYYRTPELAKNYLNSPIPNLLSIGLSQESWQFVGHTQILFQPSSVKP